MKIQNKDLIQSYVLSAAKYDFSVHEKRILYRLIELCQFALSGQKLAPGFSVQHQVFQDLKTVTMPLRSFMKSDEDQNYMEVKKALRSLRNKTIDYEQNGKWKLIGIIELPRFDIAGSVEFSIHPEIYDAILDFGKGFKKYEIAKAMEYESIYSMRFYELFSNQKTPIRYSVEQLKEMFLLQGKYSRVNDFFRKVILAAKKELDAKSPWTFDYVAESTGKKITHILFTPKFQPKFRDPDLEKKDVEKRVSLSWDLEYNEIEYLKHQIGFDSVGLKNNMDLIKFVKNTKKSDFFEWLVDLKENALMKGVRTSLPGYVIGAMKKVRDNELTK